MLAKYFILTVVGTYFFLLELENERNIKSYALKISHFHVTSKARTRKGIKFSRIWISKNVVVIDLGESDPYVNAYVGHAARIQLIH